MGSVDEGCLRRIGDDHGIESIDVAPNRVATARHADIGGKDKSGVGTPQGGPAPGNDDEVAHVVGDKRPPLAFAHDEQRLVVLSFPPFLDGGDNIVATMAQTDGDLGRVVVIESQPHARAR